MRKYLLPIFLCFPLLLAVQAQDATKIPSNVSEGAYTQGTLALNAFIKALNSQDLSEVIIIPTSRIFRSGNPEKEVEKLLANKLGLLNKTDAKELAGLLKDFKKLVEYDNLAQYRVLLILDKNEGKINAPEIYLNKQTLTLRFYLEVSLEHQFQYVDFVASDALFKFITEKLLPITLEGK